MSSSRIYSSVSEKRKRKRETEEKIKSYIKLVSSEEGSKSEESGLTKSIPELPDAAPNTSGYPDPEHPQQSTTKNQS
ncbi:hypothetical protein WA026_001942 [Henosepilachna vigintioctopunctata]|uniref:Uncharacterized protein n=1 Tax=Henosepilachna vigintioctopunctata TaxID=420089 RepID=A0AAW1UVZ6_9CUCU